MNAVLLFGAVIMSFLTARAQEIPIVDGQHAERPWTAAEVARQIHPGEVIVMGELHDFNGSTQAQMELMQALRSAGLSVSVGVEFFDYLAQGDVQAYREGRLAESDFLKKVGWGGFNYSHYRAQVLFPRLEKNERTLAINAPRALTGRIAKVGLEGLTAAEKALLPPGFELGNAGYKKRFLANMPHLPDPAAGDRYFAAQSAWDDTMAWQATEFMRSHRDQVLVIMVGDMHAQYGGGLPARLQARMAQRPWVFSTVNRTGLSSGELQSELQPSVEYGPRADFIWVLSEPQSNLR